MLKTVIATRMLIARVRLICMLRFFMITNHYKHFYQYFDSFIKQYFILFSVKSHLYIEYVILFIVKVSELGEFGLIARLDKMIETAKAGRFGDDLLIGIGDDCAAWKCTGKIQLATVDSMVEGVHFTLDTATWREIGWKSLAINLSDIAAMGGVPRYTLINLALPPDTNANDIFQLYDVIIDLAKQTKTAIVGGNISGAPQVSITITVIGESLDECILKRSSAKPGDAIAVTGWPGSAAGGLTMLMQKLKIHQEDAPGSGMPFFIPRRVLWLDSYSCRTASPPASIRATGSFPTSAISVRQAA